MDIENPKKCIDRSLGALEIGNMVPHFPAKSPLSPRAFSLIELLVVMAVAALLMGMTIAGFSGTDAGRLRGAGEAVSGMIGLARESAIASRDLSVLVIPQEGAKAYRTLAVFTRSLTDSQWRQETPWKDLPRAVYFDPSADLEGSLFEGVATPAPPDFPQQVGLSGESLSPTAFRFLAFESDGAPVDIHATPLRMRLISGDWSPTEGMAVHNPQNFYELLVLQGAATVRHIRP